MFNQVCLPTTDQAWAGLARRNPPGRARARHVSRVLVGRRIGRLSCRGERAPPSSGEPPPEVSLPFHANPLPTGASGFGDTRPQPRIPWSRSSPARHSGPQPVRHPRRGSNMKTSERPHRSCLRPDTRTPRGLPVCPSCDRRRLGVAQSAIATACQDSVRSGENVGCPAKRSRASAPAHSALAAPERRGLGVGIGDATLRRGVFRREGSACGADRDYAATIHDLV